MCFLKKTNINDFDKIIQIINKDKNFEHIGDIIFLLAKYDKKRDLNSLELKKAVYTIIEELVKNNEFKVFKYLNGNKKIVFKKIDDMFIYLDQNWESTDIREYLLFFNKAVI